MQSSTQLNTFHKVANSTNINTPMMLVDTQIVRDRCLEFKKYLPDIQLYYALKSFSDNEIVNAVDDLVDGYDVASISEINQLISLGVSSRRMAYSNPIKSSEDILQAFRLGITRFAFQSEGELEKLAKEARGAEVYLRLKVADSASEISFSSKFGANKEDALELLFIAKELGLKPIGLTFHVGSQAEDQTVWDKALEGCRGIIDESAQKGLDLDLVNLGGGIPAMYTDNDPSIKQVASSINKAIKNNVANLSLMSEPGRYLVADCAVIVTTIIGIEERRGRPWIFLDTGAFQSFFEVFEFGYFPYPVYSLKHLSEDLKVKNNVEYVLSGPSCDSYDTMSKSVKLPKDLKVGDRLMVGMTGAYTVVYGSNFNGFEVPKRIFI